MASTRISIWCISFQQAQLWQEPPGARVPESHSRSSICFLAGPETLSKQLDLAGLQDGVTKYDRDL